VTPDQHQAATLAGQLRHQRTIEAHARRLFGLRREFEIDHAQLRRDLLQHRRKIVENGLTHAPGYARLLAEIDLYLNTPRAEGDRS